MIKHGMMETGTPINLRIPDWTRLYYTIQKDGSLMLGTWQQIVLFEMDTRQRKREIIVQIIGE